MRLEEGYPFSTILSSLVSGHSLGNFTKDLPTRTMDSNILDSPDSALTEIYC